MTQTLVEKKEMRNNILSFEDFLAQQPGAKFGNCYPLEHSFGDGIYVRQISVPAGEIIVTRLFRQTHATFLLKGEVSVVTENGVERIKAPFSLITKTGTKRVIFTHTDVVWTTVHANPDEIRDIEKLEDQITAKSYEELEFSANERKILEMAVTQ